MRIIEKGSTFKPGQVEKAPLTVIVVGSPLAAVAS